jgi:hypothetical protein
MAGERLVIVLVYGDLARKDKPYVVYTWKLVFNQATAFRQQRMDKRDKRDKKSSIHSLRLKG